MARIDQTVVVVVVVVVVVITIIIIVVSFTAITHIYSTYVQNIALSSVKSRCRQVESELIVESWLGHCF